MINSELEKVPTTFIYVLMCPLTQEVRYVGKSNTPKRRLIEHVGSSKSKNNHRSNWINKLSREV